MRLYIETSVPNFLFVHDAIEKRRVTEQFFELLQSGAHVGCVSALYFQEIAEARPLLRRQLEAVVEVYGLEVVPVTEAARQLAQIYIDNAAFTAANDADALHVAVAAERACDAIVSWNFRHIVRLWTMKKVAGVNHERGLTEIVICTPEEVIAGV